MVVRHDNVVLALTFVFLAHLLFQTSSFSSNTKGKTHLFRVSVAQSESWSKKQRGKWVKYYSELSKVCFFTNHTWWLIACGPFFGFQAGLCVKEEGIQKRDALKKFWERESDWKRRGSKSIDFLIKGNFFSIFVRLCYFRVAEGVRYISL